MSKDKNARVEIGETPCEGGGLSEGMNRNGDPDIKSDKEASQLHSMNEVKERMKEVLQ